jgi:uncharacterized protein HemX
MRWLKEKWAGLLIGLALLFGGLFAVYQQRQRAQRALFAIEAAQRETVRLQEERKKLLAAADRDAAAIKAINAQIREVRERQETYREIIAAMSQEDLERELRRLGL